MQKEISLVTRIDPLSSADLSLQNIPVRCKQLKHMIGNTPLLAIRFAFRGNERVIYAKAEHINMTGSIKDRMAFYILKKAFRKDAFNRATLSRKQPAATREFRLPRLAARWDIRSSSSCRIG